jgi:restriction system protein
MSRRSTRYYAEISHEGLGKRRVISGTDEYLVERKAELQLAEWGAKWKTEQKRRRKEQAQASRLAEAIKRTEDAQASLAEMSGILAHTLTVDDAIDWEALKDHSNFAARTPAQPTILPEPKRDSPRYRPKLGLLDRLSGSRREARLAEAQALFDREHGAWRQQRQDALAAYQADLSAWEKERDNFLQKQSESNNRIDQRRQEYLACSAGAIIDYCDLVLANSSYPDWCSPSFEIDYLPDSRTLLVDYQLPALEALPRLKEVKYVRTRDEFKESLISDAELNRLYDHVVYQIVLRTAHELFEADKVEAIDAVVLNGWVRFTDRRIGQEATACIMSLQTSRTEFLAIKLDKVDAKQCFKALKGVGSAKLHTLTPVAPLMEMNREDRRFIQGREVADKIQEGDNLATLPWEDFEHLVRELFDKELAHSGGEVKVTQASRDGGVDAIAFDPDPIRGGKIAIQAKRYTRTVGVSAVRDLYGTVLNEGATKGILVTTSDYGPDAYEFARGKPITLLSGANLLHLLARHGYKARIDLHEARLLGGQEE